MVLLPLSRFSLMIHTFCKISRAYIYSQVVNVGLLATNLTWFSMAANPKIQTIRLIKLALLIPGLVAKRTRCYHLHSILQTPREGAGAMVSTLLITQKTKLPFIPALSFRMQCMCLCCLAIKTVGCLRLNNPLQFYQDSPLR
jgi:hypothetical protein